jgi:hypothetical protein
MPATAPLHVVVKDVDMPIGSMCLFMVKWAVASIPAVIILSIMGVLAAAVFGGLFRALLH